MPKFTHIADESLTPELLQMKRSLQADYTRKTQEAAPWRKMAREFGVENPEQVREAMRVYSRKTRSRMRGRTSIFAVVRFSQKEA